MNPEIEKLIERVAKESGKSAKEIRAMMNKRKEATHGLLSDYGAIYAVAKEFGIDLSEDKLELKKISEISKNETVNVAGRVKAIFPPREFERNDGSRGRFASIILMDESGEIRLVLWNNNVGISNRVGKNDIILVRNAYARENINNEVELHTGSLTTITINPRLEIKLPKVKEELVKISDIKKEMQDIDLICRVYMYYPQTEFKRDDGSMGKRASFIAEDETGKMRVVLWDSASDTRLERGNIVRIENAYVRENINNELEIHVGNRGRILHVDAKLNLPELEPEKELKINEINSIMTGFSISGRVLQIYGQRPYVNGLMASLILGDETGTIRTVLWNEKSDIVNEIKRGDAIRIKNAYSRENINNELEIHVGRYGEIIVNQDLNLPSLEEIENSLIREKDIVSLERGDRYVKISGKIVDIEMGKRLIYMTCPNCGRSVQNLGLGWFCEFCSEDVEPIPNIVFSFTLEDNTSSIRVVSFRENAEKLIGMDVEEVMNIIGETQDELEPLNRVRDKLINREVSVIGRVRYNEFSDQIELIVDNVL